MHAWYPQQYLSSVVLSSQSPIIFFIYLRYLTDPLPIDCPMVLTFRSFDITICFCQALWTNVYF